MRAVSAFAAVLCLASAAFCAPERLPGDADRLAWQSVDAALSGEYGRASGFADSLTALDGTHPSGWLLKAIVFFARYDDLTELSDVDSAAAALARAESLAVASGSEFWTGAAEYERGLLLAMRGHPVKGALATRSGAARLSRLADNDDAQALAAVYDYYLSDAVSWLPFVADGREEARNRLLRGVDSTRYFGAIYREALVWIHWAEGECDRGLSLVEPVLEKHPGNRVFAQIRGDLLRRAKRWAEARSAYAESLRQYREAGAAESVRGVCALGNLALIAGFQNDLPARDEYLRRFKLALPPVEKRMPKSLMDEMKRAGLL